MYRDDRLAGNWECLLDRLCVQGADQRWGELEPALAGAGLRELAAQLRRGGDLRRADDVLGALVRLAAADGHDDPDAVLLLHLLSEGASALAGRLTDLTGDVLSLVVGELTVQIRTFPWRRRTRAYAANLLLDTKAALIRELRPHQTRTFSAAGEVLVDPTDRARMALLLDGSAPGADQDDGLDLVDVLVWAAQLQVAAAWGISERTLRRRRDRALSALQAASGSYLALCA